MLVPLESSSKGGKTVQLAKAGVSVPTGSKRGGRTVEQLLKACPVWNDAKDLTQSEACDSHWVSIKSRALIGYPILELSWNEQSVGATAQYWKERTDRRGIMTERL